MLEKYNLIIAKALQKTGRLWSDTTMIDLFFVTFVILRFFQNLLATVDYHITIVRVRKT